MWTGAALFRGTTFLNLDAKGRLAIPAKYRERLQSSYDSHLVITIDPQRCLLIYPLSTWVEIERELDQLPSLNENARKLKRLFIGHAQDVDMDAQGRLLLPPSLRSFASLDKRAALVGQGKKFELWDEETWNSSCNDWLNEGVDLAQVESSPGIASLNI